MTSKMFFFVNLHFGMLFVSSEKSGCVMISVTIKKKKYKALSFCKHSKFKISYCWRPAICMMETSVELVHFHTSFDVLEILQILYYHNLL